MTDFIFALRLGRQPSWSIYDVIHLDREPQQGWPAIAHWLVTYATAGVVVILHEQRRPAAERLGIGDVTSAFAERRRRRRFAFAGFGGF